MRNRDWKFKLGLILIIFSCLLFLTMPLIAFLGVDGKIKITVSTTVFIIAEILFWTGGLLLGKELFNKYKSYINPINWFSKKAD